ncbi:hypothetical protein [Comamonas sp. JC664]|uniref:hypothetical protein n=1 Tax=Comamonas sp. JC664 TaxID=2801917 RepID=UPI00174DA02C|nr:hypothetical protein [Comamonas sp. JC664]MBL0693303.1 hypothetical protein [Comamonas sp. JC664]GHG71751.1 hypothetical protein GCM10012319_17160 [Comamonas sp. KCTC 72670]
MSSTLESYELIRFAEAFEARLATAGEMLTGRPGLDPEKGWLATALELVRTARAPTEGVLDRVKDLPELEEAREEYAFHQQGLWVDALEKLHAGITFTASSRAPVIEALFPHLKFPQLRRAPREAVLEYATSYERRTKSAYVTRIFGREDFALVRPVMEQVLVAHHAWRTSHEPGPLTLEQEALLREELVSLGRKLEQSLRQARLLAEAALVPVPTVYEAAGLHLKPKRRAGRGLLLADDAMAGFDDAGDSMEPTEAELAEVAALDAGGDIAAQEAPAESSSDDAPTRAAAPSVDGEAPQAADAASADSPAPTEAPAVNVDGAAPTSDAVDGTAASSDSVGEATAPPEGHEPGPQAAPMAADEGTSVEARDAAGPAQAPEARAGRKGRKKAEAPAAIAPEVATSPSSKGDDGVTRPDGDMDAAAGDSSNSVPPPKARAQDAAATGGSANAGADEAQAPRVRKKGESATADGAEPQAGEAQAPRVRKKKGASSSSSTTEST